jgi:menaquinone-dependent protoporphyrinogen IX oxidase
MRNIMKSAVIYQSKTGYSKKYAEWIAEELAADLFPAAEFNPAAFSDYDVIVFGGGLYEVGINGVGLIRKNLAALRGKKVVVYASGVAPSSQEVIDEVRNNNFTPEEQKHIRFYYLRGGFDFSRLTPRDKVLMRLLKWKILAKKAIRMKLIPDEIGMLQVYKNPADFTRKEKIGELLEYVRG